MQQAESENPVTQEMSTNGENEVTDSVPTYDQQFPSLGGGGGGIPTNSAPPIGRWNKKPPLQSSIITQLFFIPAEERKGLNVEGFGGGEAHKKTGPNHEQHWR